MLMYAINFDKEKNPHRANGKSAISGEKYNFYGVFISCQCQLDTSNNIDFGMVRYIVFYPTVFTIIKKVAKPRTEDEIFRAFWIICCTLSWVATGLLIRSAWNDFQNNSISFVVETSYLDWDTHFPSIAICETDNQENIAKVTDQ